jgi:hypothetical protein
MAIILNSHHNQNYPDQKHAVSSSLAHFTMGLDKKLLATSSTAPYVVPRQGLGPFPLPDRHPPFSSNNGIAGTPSQIQQHQTAAFQLIQRQANRNGTPSIINANGSCNSGSGFFNGGVMSPHQVLHALIYLLFNLSI